MHIFKLIVSLDPVKNSPGKLDHYPSFQRGGNYYSETVASSGHSSSEQQTWGAAQDFRVHILFCGPTPTCQNGVWGTMAPCFPALIGMMPEIITLLKNSEMIVFCLPLAWGCSWVTLTSCCCIEKLLRPVFK